MGSEWFLRTPQDSCRRNVLTGRRDQADMHRGPIISLTVPSSYSTAPSVTLRKFCLDLFYLLLTFSMVFSLQSGNSSCPYNLSERRRLNCLWVETKANTEPVKFSLWPTVNEGGVCALSQHGSTLPSALHHTLPLNT